MSAPEELARQNFEKQPEACGGVIQFRRDLNCHAARGSDRQC